MHATRMILIIAVLAASSAKAENTLGRLFLTPAERSALDAQRSPQAGAPANRRVERQAGDRLVLNGVVTRSGGAEVIWVNGSQVRRRAGQRQQLRRGPDQRNRVTLRSAAGKTVRLKPGQVWDPATGRVADCFGCAATTRKTDLLETPAAVAIDAADGAEDKDLDDASASASEP